MLVIVIGLGVIGSATAYQLASRGHQVLAFDANTKGHALGSSHGKTRITRQAYFEAAEYVPLVQHAQKIWQQLEAETAQTLFSPTGGIFVGEPGGSLVEGSLASAVRHGLPHELLDANSLMKRFPAFKVPQTAVALFEPGAGVLHADRCLSVLQDRAADFGAKLHYSSPVINWSANANSASVQTADGRTYKGDALVITAGPWSSQLLPALNLPLSVRRMLCAHFQPKTLAPFQPEDLPVWCIELAGQFLYGFPCLEEQGLKAGRHDAGEPCTPDSARRSVTEEEVEALAFSVNTFLPGAADSVKETLTCLYTDTPDGNFIVDRHPEFLNVAFMSGCSGHAFKFGPAIGSALADLVTVGKSKLPIDFLSLANR